MKKIFLSLFLVVLLVSNIFGQINNSDSIQNEKKIETIRKNVQEFFIQQNRRFSNKLEGLNEEYLLYFMPKYNEKGLLMYNLDKLDNNLNMSYDYLKQNCFENNTVVPEQVVKYSNFLISRTNGYWCENRFGYDNLKTDDDFGILFIYSPKNIPDSLSILKQKQFSSSDYENASETKKRMLNLLFKQMNIQAIVSRGLNERFIKVVLKY
jgi:hypothetical protein